MTRLRIMGTRRDPVWSGARRAAELVMRSTRKGPRAARPRRIQLALERVLPNAGHRFAQVIGPSPSTAQMQQAATVALSNALLDHYMGLGLKVWESRSDPRVINVLDKAGLSGLGGDPELDEAAKVMLNVACDPSTVGVVSGIVGAFTYGIGGAIVGAGGGLAQQAGCAQGSPSPSAPVPPPQPPPEETSAALPRWIVPAAVGVGFALFAGLIIYGASQ